MKIDTKLTSGIIDTINLGGSSSDDPLSFLNLFVNADFVVKFVIILLVLASFWSWTIIFEKMLKIKRLKRKANAFEKRFWSGKSIDELFEQSSKSPRDPMSKLFVIAMREWKRSVGKNLRSDDSIRVGLQQRIEKMMSLTISKEMESVEKYMSFLASTGAVAPFVGLFGTVWGIMNSFKMIGIAKAASLSVVAPGISEALFATALGLVAAIPAVLAYNKLSNDLNRYASRLEFFASELAGILSRQLEDFAVKSR